MKVEISMEASEKDYGMNLKIADGIIREFIDFDSPMGAIQNKAGLIALEEVAEHILTFVKSVNKVRGITKEV